MEHCIDCNATPAALAIFEDDSETILCQKCADTLGAYIDPEEWDDHG